MAYKYSKRHPGPGSHLVICDVCGLKLQAKDTVLISDKYNLLNNMRVCKADADKTNPQSYLRSVREKQITNPDLLRPESTDVYVFASEPDEIYTRDASDPTGITASAPKHLIIIGASSSFVELQWLGPDSPGSSSPTGYKIERESPVGGGFSTLTTTTSPAKYYKDETVSASTQYNYRVSVVSAAGTGTASNEADVTTSAS